MKFSLVSALAFTASALAITVTQPAMNAVVDPSKDFTISWTSVSTDPSTVTIQLVNMAGGHTPVQITLASNVQTSSGTYTVAGGTVSNSGTAFQIDLLSTDPQNTGILAQSQQFNLSSSSSSSASTTSVSSSSASSAPTSTSSASSGSASTATTTKASSSIVTATTSSAGSATTVTGVVIPKTSPASSSSSAAAQFTGAATVNGGNPVACAAVAGLVALLA